MFLIWPVLFTYVHRRVSADARASTRTTSPPPPTHNANTHNLSSPPPTPTPCRYSTFFEVVLDAVSEEVYARRGLSEAAVAGAVHTLADREGDREVCVCVCVCVWVGGWVCV
jgi:hypothetical protein